MFNNKFILDLYEERRNKSKDNGNTNMSDALEIDINDDMMVMESNANTMNDNSETSEPRSSSSEILNWEQVKKLDHLLNCVVPIHGRYNFPTLTVCLKDFIRNLKKKLEDSQINVNSIHINGGVASYIIAEKSKESAYSDIDIIFACDILGEKKTNNCDLIKNCVFKCLYDYMPTTNDGECNQRTANVSYLKDAYVKKMVKVIDAFNCWSLIALCNNEGQNIELKFVDKMKRRFQFSVDSFQVHLDSLLYYYDFQESNKQVSIMENFYPTVQAKSLFGDFKEAKNHLDNKLIATKSPEEIRGGGLLKYCNLLVKGYKAADVHLMESYEKYMCSRFFIDFNDINTQKHVLVTYLESHFQPHDYLLIFNYLMKLHEIVNKV
jgi:hypothetical protein